MKKKIAIVTTNIINNGGTERVIANVCNLLEDRFNITIYSLSTDSGECFYPLNNNIEIIHMGFAGYEHETSIVKKNILRLGNISRALSYFRKIECDYFLGVNKNINILLLLSLYFCKRSKIIGWEHFAYNAPMSKIIAAVRGFLYQRLDKLIVLTEFDKHFYTKAEIDTVVIPNSVSPLDNHDKVVLSNVVLAVGRHTEQKRFDRLLRIWRLVKALGHDEWTLKIFGDGPLLEKNKMLASELGIHDSVSFLMPTKDIGREYRSSAFLVMTSAYEAFPMVLLEALKSGLPCVAYDCDTGPRDIIVSGEDGLVIPYADEDKFVLAVDTLIRDPLLRQGMGEAAISNVQRFSDENIRKKWIDLFESM